MKLLRQDLVIYPAVDDGRKFIIKDPTTNEQFELGEREFYVINEIRRPYHERVLLIKFNAKFGEKETPDYLNELISMFDGWGLLIGNGGTDNSPEKTSEKNKPAAVLAGKELKLKVNHFSLFCPQKLLDDWVSTFKNIPYFRYCLFILPLVLFVVAVVGLIHNFHAFDHDLAIATSKFNFITHTIYCLVTINLLTRIAEGCVARYFGINTLSFGFMLAFGLIPEFDLRVDISPDSDRKGQLWLYSASLFVRIFLFSAGIVLWMITRHMGSSSIAILSAALSWYALLTLVIVWNPLISSSATKFLSVYFNSPTLRRKANRSLLYLFFSPPRVIKKHYDNVFAFRVYALGSLLMLVALIAIVGYRWGSWFKDNYGGLGIILLIGTATYVFFFFRHALKISKQLRTGANIKDKPSPAGETVRAENNKERRTIIARYPKMSLLLVVIAIILFLPYHYETGGEAQVFSLLRQGIYPDSKGIVRHVYYNGGERLKKGTIIAEMEADTYIKNVETTRQAINQLREQIKALETTPSAEQVEFANEQIRTAKQKLQLSTRNYANKEKLYNMEAIAEMDYITAKEQMDLDIQDVQEKEDALKALLTTVNAHTLAAEKYNLAGLQQQFQLYELELERTKLRMPEDGMIITMDLKNLENKFLDDAQLFAEMEDCNHYKIEISIPVSDVDQVAIGNKVTFKAQLFPTKPITGTVESIYPVAGPDPFDSPISSSPDSSSQSANSVSPGQVVQVVCIIRNDSCALKTGMTGYAKIEGKKMLVAQAFSRAVVRFILIELWSWLP